jgi:hypothetical protein
MSTPGNTTFLANSLSPDPIVAEQVNGANQPKILAVKLHGGPLNVDNGPDPVGGSQTVNVPTGAANNVVKAAGGRLCRVLVTTAGTGAGGVLIYDNATTNSGTVIGYIPATIAVGTQYTFDMPAANGIVVANVANGPVLTVSFN